MLLLGWYLVGLIGSYLCYFTFLWLDDEYYRCPTPMALLLIIPGALLGPFILGVGLLLFLIIGGVILSERSPNFWNTPVCKLFRRL